MKWPLKLTRPSPLPGTTLSVSNKPEPKKQMITLVGIIKFLPKSPASPGFFLILFVYPPESLNETFD
jgi:hypothetical protein